MLMAFDPYEEISRARPQVNLARGRTFRVVLVFSAAAVAVALIVSNMLERGGVGRQAAGLGTSLGLDYTATGTVAKGERYTIRRSVLQPSPESVCILHQNGARSGEC
jgi:hypothetical protein